MAKRDETHSFCKKHSISGNVGMAGNSVGAALWTAANSAVTLAATFHQGDRDSPGEN